MPDPDRSDAEIIDFSPNPPRTRLFIAIAAAICQLTHDQPATACTPAVRSLLPGG